MKDKDPEKQKAIEAVKDEGNRGYDVGGVKCFTAAQVEKHWPKAVEDAAHPDTLTERDTPTKSKRD